MRTSRPLALLAALALTVGLGACGDDGDDGGDETTTTTAAAPTEPTEGEEPTDTTEGEEPTETTEGEDEGPTPEEEEEAVALAESVNLTLDDFADGWSGTPASSDDEDDDTDQCFADAGLDIDELTVGDAESPVFSIESADGARTQQAQTDTAVFADAETAEEVIAAVATEDFGACAQEAVVASFEEEGTDATLELELVEDLTDLGDEAAGFDGGLALTGDGGQEATGQLGLYLIRTENVVTVVSLVDIGDIAYDDTLEGLLSTVADRQASEVG